MHIRLLSLAALLSTLLLAPTYITSVRAATNDCDINPTRAECIDPAFTSYWDRNGGLPVFGYPLGRALPEQTADGTYAIQHFERNRLELHPDTSAPYTIQLGRIGAERLAQMGRGIEPPVAPNRSCRFFAETGHNVCGNFWRYWRANGLDLGDPGMSERESLALFGLPLTEPTWETNSSGDRVLTQWFERARLEDHAGTILQGLLDAELQAASVPAAPTPGFVTIAGDKLVQGGQPIFLKGTNYYPAAQPWRDMWLAWDGPTVNREVSRARRELGINTIRILVPFRRYEGWTDGRGNVRPEMLDRLREFVQIAGQQQLKVIVTLFDWQDTFGAAGSPEESYDLNYLQTIVNAFKDDDRVLAWDLHNEPDNYGAWNVNASAVVDWLARMRDALRMIDQPHPVTVGMGRNASLWQAGPDGRTIADLSDFISVHSYDAAAYDSLVAQIRTRTTKPVVLEEFGWASGPDCRGTYFDETSQSYLYGKAQQAGAQREFAGMLNWWLQDPPLTSSYSVDENGYYGVYRQDGTPKPAVAPFRALRVPPLPSTTVTNRNLTIAPQKPRPAELQPIIFPDGIVLKDEFKYFWTFFGGEATFGKPLTQAYRDVGGTLVQYFERARFELNADEDTTLDPLAPELQNAETYLKRVRLTPLGQQALRDRAVETVPDPQQPDVRYFPATGHTIRGDFRTLWEPRGERFFGPPLTEPLAEVIAGQPTRVQYFTYWRFEQQGSGPVRLAPLGVDALQRRQCPRPY